MYCEYFRFTLPHTKPQCDISLYCQKKQGFPDSSVGKESACNARDSGSIPGSGRSAGEGIGYPFLGFPYGSAGKESDLGSIPELGRSPGEERNGYPLQYSWASLVAQLVKNPPAVQETWVRSLGREDPLGKG